MRGLATLIVMLVTLAVGIFIGGSLGVLGKPNDVYLQTNYTTGVIPYFHQGDRIHFFDPNLDLVNGQFAPVTDITIPANHTPCKNLDSNGICIIDVASGTYKYKCRFCKDPTIPVGTNGPVNGLWGGDSSAGNGGQNSSLPRSTMPGSDVEAAFTLKMPDQGNSGSPATSTSSHTAGQPAALASLYSYDSFYAKLARAFVAAFFTPKITPGQTIRPEKPLVPAVNASTVQAYIDCGGPKNVISVETPDLWEPETTFPLAVGTQITWASQTGFDNPSPHKPPFIVQDDGSGDFKAACGGPLAANNAGNTLACTLAGSTANHTVKYTIVDPTSKCTAPSAFELQVGAASSTPPAGTGVSLPGLR